MANSKYAIPDPTIPKVLERGYEPVWAWKGGWYAGWRVKKGYRVWKIAGLEREREAIEPSMPEANRLSILSTWKSAVAHCLASPAGHE